MKHFHPFLMLLLLLIASFNLSAQVTKINSNVNFGSSFALKSRFIFLDGNNNFWSTDGTDSVQPYAQGLTAQNLFYIVFNDKLYFYGSSPAGAGIYATDGTDAGTHFITSKITSPRFATACRDMLFVEGSDNINGNQLWKTDGTDAGTQIVKVFTPGLPDFDQPYAVNNTLFFAATDSINGDGLWKTDGTDTGTSLVKSISFHTGQYYLDNGYYWIDSLNSKVVFSNNVDWWSSDGTSAGTQKIYNDSLGAYAGVNLNSKYYYTGYSPTGLGLSALWVTDGTQAGTVLVKDSTNFRSSQIGITGNELICPAYELLYASDGTGNGTNQIDSFAVLPVSPFYENSSPIMLFNAGNNTFQQNKIFFIASDGVHDFQLRTTDGTTGNTSMVKIINPRTGGPFRQPFPSLMMPEYQLVANYIYTPKGIYFAANDSIHGMELWQSDGTEAGTRLVKDINPGILDSDPQFVGTFNNHIYFTAVDSGYGTYFTGARSLFVIDAADSALPLTVTNFTAAPVKQNVQVNWVTSTEINTSHFNVQRSLDGATFENIGTVAAAGNSATKKSYQYTDVNALNINAQVLYYRLQTNDKDGRVSYSTVVPVPVKTGLHNLVVYPSPAKDVLQLFYNSPSSQNAIVRVINGEGKTVFSSKLTNLQGFNQASINVATLAPGVYYLQVITDNNVKNTRFVKE